MHELKEYEMKQIDGGGDIITATMLNAIYRIVETIYNLGDAFGSTIRRTIEGKHCSL